LWPQLALPLTLAGRPSRQHLQAARVAMDVCLQLDSLLEELTVCEDFTVETVQRVVDGLALAEDNTPNVAVLAAEAPAVLR